MKLIYLFLLALSFYHISIAQTIVTSYPDSIEASINQNYTPGVFYVPKTQEAQADFLNNGIHQNAIRTHIIESAINNSSDINQSLAYLDNVSTIIQSLAAKTDKLIFIFEKMPAWLSSSNDGSPATTPGWYVLNTKPPSSYTQWNSAITAITSKLVNDYGITNAYFEIWNEPDLGSWTGTEAEFFELFSNTYAAIKAVNNNIPVGGPATNYWGNHIYTQPPYGYLTHTIANTSLIGALIDSSVLWNKPLDFISWHNFNHTYQTYQNAVDYINYKYTSHSQNTPELIVSEWNAPSVSRDTPIQKSYFIKNLIAIANTRIDNNLVAAWQDFSQSSNEFHNDYGLVSYGAIHKPAYNSLLLANQLKGQTIKHTTSAPLDVIQSLSNDTLNILIGNYIPPAFAEAFNYTLYEGNFNASELDAQGFINISANDLSHLDSIYKGLITIPSSTPINIAINNAIPIYEHYDSLQTIARTIQLSINGYSNNYSGHYFLIDNNHNNNQFTYDSLINAGVSQNNAIQQLTTNQALNSIATLLPNGSLNFTLEPNAVILFQFKIPELSGLNQQLKQSKSIAYPNPTNGLLKIEGIHPNETIKILNIQGQMLQNYSNTNTLDFSNYPKGTYLIHLEQSKQTIKVIKE
ncbi:MAG: T9SS type A sorting domain-containing protein [Flavobacteriales bacterium]|jgi:beta-xylosidase|nr:T9SS type A sorting domain-containing protein [Flavobacteriales bacterium]